MPNWLFKPLTEKPKEYGRILRDSYDPIGEPDRGIIKPFLAGAMEGTGDVLSDMTSPFSIAAQLMGGGGFARLRALKALRLSKPSAIPASLGPEFVPVGGERAFNALRTARMAEEAKRLKDMAYEGSRLTGGSLPISGEIDVAEAMARIAKARGR